MVAKTRFKQISALLTKDSASLNKHISKTNFYNSLLEIVRKRALSTNNAQKQK